MSEENQPHVVFILCASALIPLQRSGVSTGIITDTRLLFFLIHKNIMSQEYTRENIFGVWDKAVK
jgi:hypothetical protein